MSIFSMLVKAFKNIINKFISNKNDLDERTPHSNSSNIEESSESKKGESNPFENEYHKQSELEKKSPITLNPQSPFTDPIEKSSKGKGISLDLLDPFKRMYSNLQKQDKKSPITLNPQSPFKTIKTETDKYSPKINEINSHMSNPFQDKQPKKSIEFGIKVTPHDNNRSPDPTANNQDKSSQKGSSNGVTRG